MITILIAVFAAIEAVVIFWLKRTPSRKESYECVHAWDGWEIDKEGQILGGKKEKLGFYVIQKRQCLGCNLIDYKKDQMI